MSGNTYITRSLKLNNVLQFVESFSEPANNMYFMFAGKHLPWATESRPPRSSESVKSLVTDIYDDMIYGKNVTPSDVVPVVRKVVWTSNTVYQAYTDDTADLFATDFYVAAQDGTNYKVYKCLDNNGGVPSVVKPTAAVATDNDYTTSDGYRWKWLYTVSESDWNKFTTSTHMPVIPNANVSSNAVSGAIDVIRVEDGGRNYNSYHSGVIHAVAVGGDQTLHQIDVTAASNAGFYIGSAIQIMTGPAAGQTREIVDYTVNGSSKIVRVASAFSPQPTASCLYEISPLIFINGDGQGCVARAIINTSSNSISRIEVVERGSGYTWANATIQANTGNISNLSPTSANIVIVIPPPGGHGANVYDELGVTSTTISVTFDASQSSNNIINQNDIRVFGLIQDPLFANVVVNISTPNGAFTVGETVRQSNTDTTGIVTAANSSVLKLTRVRGYIQTGYDITGLSSNAVVQAGAVTGPGAYYNQTLELFVDINGINTYQLDELVTQGNHATGYVQSVTQISGPTYRVRLTNVRGVFNLTDDALDLEQLLRGTVSTVEGSITDLKYGDLIRNSGRVLFTDNMAPITKSNNQIETVKLTLNF